MNFQGQKAVNGSEVDASEIASTLSQLNPVNRGKNLRKEILDCVLISRVSSSSKRQRRTTMEGSNKRAKINASSASASTSQLADPLFIPVRLGYLVFFFFVPNSPSI